ncbi:hypothetical protein SAMN06265340_1041, partial [Desulfurobacterium atlanticum]
GMNGRTPFEVLKSKWDCLFNLNVACFPVVLLEDVFVVANRLGVLEKGGENVLTPYLLKNFSPFIRSPKLSLSLIIENLSSKTRTSAGLSLEL